MPGNPRIYGLSGYFIGCDKFGHPVRTLNLSSVTVLCQNRLPYIRSGKIICKQFVHYCRNGVKNITFRNPFVIKSRRRCNCEIIALIAIPFGVNPVQRKRHDCQYICPDRIFRPGCIDFTGSNIFDIIFIFYIIISVGENRVVSHCEQRCIPARQLCLAQSHRFRLPV